MGMHFEAAALFYAFVLGVNGASVVSQGSLVGEVLAKQNQENSKIKKVAEVACKVMQGIAADVNLLVGMMIFTSSSIVLSPAAGIALALTILGIAVMVVIMPIVNGLIQNSGLSEETKKVSRIVDQVFSATAKGVNTIGAGLSVFTALHMSFLFAGDLVVEAALSIAAVAASCLLDYAALHKWQTPAEKEAQKQLSDKGVRVISAGAPQTV